MGWGMRPVGYELGLVMIKDPTPIALNASVTVPGEITILGDHHYYSFNGAQDDVFDFILSHPASSNLNGLMVLRRPGSEPFFERGIQFTLDTSDTVRSREVNDVALPATGEYIVELSRGGEAIGLAEHLGEYEVTIETP